MDRKRKVFLSLTGGLGNQLFQYAAALSRNASEIVLDTHLGAPRKGLGEGPVLDDFELHDVTWYKNSINHRGFFSKTSGYLLRSGLKPNYFEKFWPARKLIHFLGTAVMIVYFKSTFRLIQATDNGFFVISKSRRNELLVGYFQSYVWNESPSSNLKMKDLRLKSIPKDLEEYIEKYKGLKVLCVHVRRGDYRNESEFGLLPASYYELGIAEISNVYQFDKVWLFSDEPDYALSILPDYLKGKVDVVPDFNGSASATLELMRHAGAYVIANSSLSWWGARLSYSTNPAVVAPRPWFRLAPEPKQIIPSNWQRISAWDADDA
jgi:hypothetical protein